MEITREDLKKRYSTLSDADLLKLFNESELSQIASSVIKEELSLRGLTDNKIKKISKPIKEEDVLSKIVKMDGDWWLTQALFGTKHGDDIEFIIKATLVSGIFEGLIWGESPLKNQYELNITAGDTVREIDHFYSETKNRKIPVAHALRVVAMILRGIPNDQVEKILQVLRKLFPK
jgi:hypothetical protein